MFVIYYQMQYNENNCEMENVFFFGDLGITACLYRILIQNQKILHYFRMSPYIMNNEHILKGA